MRTSIALIGWGYWGQIVGRYLSNSESFDLARIVSPERCPGPIWTPRLEEVLEDSNISCVFVASPLASHYAVVKACLNHGKHVLCEKPLASSLEEATELVQLAGIKGLCLHTSYIYTCSRGVGKVKALLPLLGTVSYAEFSIRQLGRFYQESVYSVLGCHLLSVLGYLWSLDSFGIEYIPAIFGANGVCESGLMLARRKDLLVRMDLSLNEPEKCRIFSLWGECGLVRFNSLTPNTVVLRRFDREGSEAFEVSSEAFTYDESNNLELLLEQFSRILEGKETDNRELSLAIVSALSGNR